MSINQSNNRYFLLTAEMLISEELTKVLIATSANHAEEMVEDDFTYQNFSDWDSRGQDHKSAMELRKIREISLQEYLEYKKLFP